MRCVLHGKETIGLCGWCGAAICNQCIGKSSGKKIYCRKCSEKLPDKD
ncbi:MAG: hypothetical protein Q7J54_01965 [Candidatus Woesearchaeota archaeon]|nr:hypothetical protein [Candidatus Woesearchaeota archaeon]